MIRFSKWIQEYKEIISTKSKFQRGVSWNVLSFFAMGVGGIILNILLLIGYGVQTLGAFNQVYAVYLFASQLAVFGLYASVNKHISEYSENHILCSKILTSAMLLGMVIGGCVCLFYYFGVSFIGRFLDSDSVLKGLFFSIIGLWCFALNKILLAFVNGKRLMKAYALFYIYRYLSMPLFLGVLIVVGMPGYMSPVVFSITELTLLIALFVFTSRFVSFYPIDTKWFRVHLLFGSKSFAGGTAGEMNTRVDVLMLGAFLSDKAVGIYSFAAILAEGFNQIPNIFRVNYDPLITKFVVLKRLEELHLLIRRFLKHWPPISIIIGILAVILFPMFAKTITNDPEILKGWFVFIILIVGVIFKSGYSVFGGILTQSGYPGYQTVLIMLVMLSNILLNYLFIPQWGIYGAAIATSISFLLSVLYLKTMVKKLLGIKI